MCKGGRPCGVAGIWSDLEAAVYRLRRPLHHAARGPPPADKLGEDLSRAAPLYLFGAFYLTSVTLAWY
jgi:hypothetical protein